MSNPKPPIATKEPKALTIHEHVRIDNYFWMQLSDAKKNAKNPDEQTQEVLDYLDAENQYTKAVLKDTEQLQEKLYKEIVGRIKKREESVPYKSNGYWYYNRYEEEKEYAIYCRKKESLQASEEVILDANKLAEGHHYFHLSDINVSKDNKMLAYGVDTVSRRQYTLYFKNLETGEVLKTNIPNTTGSSTWANDSQTVFYTKKNEKTLRSDKIYKHKIGMDTVNDVLVYHEKDNTFYTGIYKTKSDKYLVIWSASTLTNHYQILEANHPNGMFRDFHSREENLEYSIAHFENKFYVLTNWGGKNFRLMETLQGATSKENWTEVIAHRSHVFLEGIELFKNHLVIEERKNGLTELRVINQQNKEEHYLDFGEAAYTACVSVNREFDTETLRFDYTSMVTPNSCFDYNMNTHKKTLLKQQEVVGGYDSQSHQTERIYATARDGTKIPMSIVYKKGYKKNGKSPLLLYGYGAYGVTIDPYFSSVRLSLLDRGFVYVIAHIRGGQMMGRQWYEDGKMFKKMNTFNDFIDCGKYLLENRYTCKENMYAMGGSAGGLLMGAVINLAPDLFQGVVAAVPFVDVISTMLDDTVPLTTGEYDEWGNPNDKDSYDYMLSYSPYDNVTSQKYPHLLITTGLHDSQVQYWEPAKWIAKLRDNKTDNNKLLMNTNMEAGHGGTSGRFEQYREIALEYAFLLDLAGMTTCGN